MNARKLGVIVSVTFVSYLSHVAESEKLSTNNTTRSDDRVLLGKNVRAQSRLAYSYPTPIVSNQHLQRYSYNKEWRQKEYRWRNHPIFAFGVENFLSYAAHFCKYEAENGLLEVVSVGSGYGAIENDIIAAYAQHFGGELNITLVDPDPKCRVHFRTVDDLLAERANIVRNCVLFIIWPELTHVSDGYDIQAIRKLQPRAVLTMYEPTGISGSPEFISCLNPWEGYYYSYKECSPRLDDYVKEVIAYQQVNCDPGSVTLFDGGGLVGLPKLEFWLVKLERKN